MTEAMSREEEDRMLREATQRARARLGAPNDPLPIRRKEPGARGSPESTFRRTYDSSPQALASILTRLQTNSRTTGEASSVTEGANSTGQRPSGTDAEKSRGGAVVVPHPASLARNLPSRPLSPLTNVQLVELLARLDALTRTRQETVEERGIRLTAYRERLRAFDGEPVRKAITHWPDHHEWWPTWAELRKEIEEWS